MTKTTPADSRISELSEQLGFSRSAVESMVEALLSANGSMAQFNHPEFGGYGQWMRGGMTMTSDMFNDSLKGRINDLCNALARSLTDFQNRTNENSRTSHPESNTNVGFGSSAQASISVAAHPRTSNQWWPADLGTPSTTGAQNNVRYAYFGEIHRLAIELFGRSKVYNTLDHQITGVSQQQSTGGSLTFTSQHGVVDVASLPVIHGDADPT